MADIRITREELPALIEDGPASVRATDWADQGAIYVTLPGGFDLTPLVARVCGITGGCATGSFSQVLSGDGSAGLLATGQL